MSGLRIVPDTWTGIPPQPDPDERQALKMNADEIADVFGIPRSVMRDAALAAMIQLPGALCIVTGV